MTFPRSILPISARAIRIDIMFGVYNLLLIQNPERIRRSTYPLQFTIIIRSQQFVSGSHCYQIQKMNR